MRADLKLADASIAALLAFWSLIHIPDDAVPRLSNISGGYYALADQYCSAFHVGNESRLKTQGYGGHTMKIHVQKNRRILSSIVAARPPIAGSVNRRS